MSEPTPAVDLLHVPAVRGARVGDRCVVSRRVERTSRFRRCRRVATEFVETGDTPPFRCCRRCAGILQEAQAAAG